MFPGVINKKDQMKKLIVSIRDGYWVVEHVGADRASVSELFGSPFVPTPFSASIPFGSVRERLALLNPGAEIILSVPITETVYTAFNPQVVTLS